MCLRWRRTGRAAISLWVRGGLPDSFLASSDGDSFAFRTNFIRTYLERDVAEFVSSRLPTETLGRLWTMLAHWQGGLLRASELARSLAINTATVGRYIDSLTSLFILRRLPPFVANVRKRLVKSPKIYVRDSGLVHALLRIGDFDTLAGHPVSGASWEGFVIENLLAAAPPGTGASFYRTAAGAEMDLVLELPGCEKPWAFEIKRGTAPRPSRGLRSALEDRGRSARSSSMEVRRGIPSGPGSKRSGCGRWPNFSPAFALPPRTKRSRVRDPEALDCCPVGGGLRPARRSLQRAAGGVAGVESVNPDDGQIEDAYYGAWLHYGFTSWANGAPGPRSRLVRISPRPATHCGWRAWLSAAAGLGSL